MRMLQDASDEKIVRLYGLRKDAIVPLRRRLESMMKHGMEHTIDHIVKIRDERNQVRVLKGQWLPATASYMKYRIETIFKNVPEWIFRDYKYEDDSVCTSFTHYNLTHHYFLRRNINTGTRARHGDEEYFFQPLYVVCFRFFFLSLQTFNRTHTHNPTGTHAWIAVLNWTLFFVNYVHTPVIVIIVLCFTARTETFDVSVLRNNMTNFMSCRNSIPVRVCHV